MTSSSGSAFGKERRSAREAGGLSEVVSCPTCKGRGSLSLTQLGLVQHAHRWRLWSSMGGPGVNLQRYHCEQDGCEAEACSDCRADGFETCQDRVLAEAEFVARGEAEQREYERLVASGEIPTRASRRSLPSAQTKPGTRLPTHRTGGTE